MAPFQLDEVDYLTIGLQFGVIASAVCVIAATWLWSAPIRNRATRLSLIGYHCMNLITMAQGSLCLWQQFSPSDTIYLTNAVSYGMTLAASYVFFYAKQQSVTCADTLRFFPDDFKYRHARVELLFKIAFVGYCGFVFLLPALGITVVEGMRVSYALPLYVRIMMAVGDTGLSAICLYLFVAPVLQFARMAKAVEDQTLNNRNNARATPLRRVAKRNSQMALAAVVSTTTFFIAGSFLESRIWIVAGCSDLLVNMICIRFMFRTEHRCFCIGGAETAVTDEDVGTYSSMSNKVGNTASNAPLF